MVKNAAVSVILFKSKTLANGEHPIVLRVTKNKQRKHISLGISCAADLWDFNEQYPKRKHPNKNLIEKIINAKKVEYNDQILELNSIGRDYTPESLTGNLENHVKLTTVFSFYDEIIDRLKISHKIGNANAYRDSKNSIKGFCKNKNILFSDIDIRFLNQYEAYLRSRNLADTSIAAYMRSFRALYNKAINEGVVKKDYYPFDNFKISKFKTQTQKRSITKSDIKKILELDLEKEPMLFEARSYFVFSYLGNGINFNDMAKIRWRAIVNDRIYYTRSKTSNVLNFVLNPVSKEIIEHFKNLTFNDLDDYIFPILNKNIHQSPTQIKDRIKKVLKKTNKLLKEIGEKAGIEISLTTYVARHTYADTLRKNGTDIQIISQALGHQELATTRIYLRSFANEDIDKANEGLL